MSNLFLDSTQHSTLFDGAGANSESQVSWPSLMDVAPVWAYRMSFFKDAAASTFIHKDSSTAQADSPKRVLRSTAILLVNDPYNPSFRYSADIIDHADGCRRWVGYIWGDRLWVDRSELVNGHHRLCGKTDAGTFVWAFDADEDRYVLVEEPESYHIPPYRLPQAAGSEDHVILAPEHHGCMTDDRVSDELWEGFTVATSREPDRSAGEAPA